MPRPVPATALLAAAAAFVSIAADRPSGFSFEPQPRWSEDPETEQLCEAMASECAGQLVEGQIDTSWGYAELYNADGYLVGLRSLKSTGCAPLDERMLLSHRHFVTVFSKGGAPDLEDLRIETAAGIDRGGIRLVKEGETQVSIGC